MEVLSVIVTLIVCGAFLCFVDKISLKRADKLFKERVSYFLDEIEKRKLK